MSERDINYEEVEGTWSYELKNNWLAFNEVVKSMNHDGKMDHIKFRDYVLYDMQKRHKAEENE